MLYSIFFLLKRTSLLNYKTIGFRTIKWFTLFSRDLQFIDDINWSSLVFLSNYIQSFFEFFTTKQCINVFIYCLQTVVTSQRTILRCLLIYLVGFFFNLYRFHKYFAVLIIFILAFLTWVYDNVVNSR